MERCGAKNRQGKPCGLVAGSGTDHLGTGRCRFHGGRSPGVTGNANAERTGEHSRRPTREDEFKAAKSEAPVDPTSMLQEQARTTYARLQYMYRLLLQTEQQLENLAAEGDSSAFSALAVVEISRKQEPTIDQETKTAAMVEVELSTKSRSLLDRWIAQHDAITRVELLYGRTAERLKPRGDGPLAGGIGTLIINNNMPGVDDDGDDDGTQDDGE